MNSSSSTQLPHYARPVHQAEAVTYFEQQYDQAHQDITDTIEYQYRPTFAPIIRHLFRACYATEPQASVSLYSHEMKKHLNEAERLVRWMRQHALIQASHRPHNNVRITIATDGLYLGVALGVYAGIITGRCAVDAGAYLFWSFPCKAASAAQDAITPLVRGPKTLLASLLASRKTPRRAEDTGTTHSQAPAFLTHVHAGVCAVRRSVQLVICLLGATVLGALAGILMFSARLFLMLTVFSTPLAQAIQSLDAWVGLEGETALSHIANWTRRNERIFDEMQFSMGHHIEIYRRDLFLFSQFDRLVHTFVQATASLQSRGGETLITEDMPRETISSLTTAAKQWRQDIENTANKIGKRYRATCIDQFCFDPAIQPKPGYSTSFEATELHQIQCHEQKIELNEEAIIRPTERSWLLHDYQTESDFVAQESRRCAQSDSLFGRGAQRFTEAIQNSKAFARLIALPVDTKLRKDYNKALLREYSVMFLSEPLLRLELPPEKAPASIWNRQFREFASDMARRLKVTEGQYPHIFNIIRNDLVQ